MHKQGITIAALAGLIITLIFVISTQATVTTNAASTEIYGIDIMGLTKAARDVPLEQSAAH
jgi:hypothetical protein